MAKPNRPDDLLQPVTAEVQHEVRALIEDARYASLATISPADGHPMCSRVGLATLADGTPLVFLSALAAHTSALLADSRCGLLVGEPGKGDALAHPRISITCEAMVMHGDEASAARQRFLQAHPKARIYIDLPDFRYFRMRLIGGSFNGGFGRASALEPKDMLRT